MSTLRPDLYGGQKMPSKTSNTELRVQNPDAGLAYDSAEYQIVGNVVPGTLAFQPTTAQVEVKHGTTAVTHERHMSERSAGFTASVNESSSILMALANMSSIAPVFTQATTGFTQATISAAATALQMTLSSATGLTTDDLVYTVFNEGQLTEFTEEKYVRSISGNVVTLRNPFSKAPAANQILKRATEISQIEGGSDFKERHFNIKTSADDQSVHVLNYPSAIVTGATNKKGSNGEVMGMDLTVAANATEYTGTGVSVPKFSTEHFIPRNIAKALS
jgi:hypothetical protein